MTKSWDRISRKMDDKARIAGEAMVKYRRGDPLSDEELDCSLEVMIRVVGLLRYIPEFYLARIEAVHLQLSLGDMRRARDHNRTTN